MYLLNGELRDSIAISDRSFQYGDGCFTTMLTRYGEIQHWQKHINRVNDCLDALGIVPVDWMLIKHWLSKMALQDSRAGLKLHISRGEGGRGYSPTQVTSSNVTISAFPFPSHYQQWCQNGIDLGVCSKRLGINPMLAGHKHNNRLEQVLLKADIEQQGFSDGIALDCNDKVIETTVANLFWRQDDILYTPLLTNAGVDGVMRKVVLEIADTLGISTQQSEYSIEELLTAEEVFITNSILGVAPVSAIEGKAFQIGNITRTIQEKALS